MKPEERQYLTTGQLAKRTGLTMRTLRYYDKIGLLKPAQYNQSSVRLYGKEDVARLQKIQMLKYVGLSLSEIRQFLLSDNAPEQDLRSSLKMQKEIIQHKIAHMQFVSRAIEETLGMVDEQGQGVNWKDLADIIQTIHQENDWSEQWRHMTVVNHIQYGVPLKPILVHFILRYIHMTLRIILRFATSF
ncbi:MerR family transcriptional regulator [Gordoniibacillus kamchatkensis]|uniref:MerR family transcriptional regulator n=1 Tax=Gordoniibacillus kamchatkensis TaxID=1590651 RepID=UPI000A42F5DD|nr:MerR family transcriptional regulator [Paenibacillus sp. VKM B-2647]